MLHYDLLNVGGNVVLKLKVINPVAKAGHAHLIIER